MRGKAFTVFVVVCGVGLLTACGSPVPNAARSTETSTTKVPSSDGLVAADPRLTDRVELSRNRVVSGQPISGTLVVTSKAPTPINLTKTCRPDFQVVIGNGSITPNPGFAAVCGLQPFYIQPGTNRFPITVITTYLGCEQPGGSSAIPTPTCVKNGPPPLPPGVYHTILFGSGATPLPEPAPVVVTLT